jgi:hypothetical protein
MSLLFAVAAVYLCGLFLLPFNLSIMSVHKLKQLESLLENEEDFSQTVSFFMDQFGADPAFAAMGKPAYVPVIINALGDFCTSFFKKEQISMADLNMIQVEPYRMFHGYTFVEGHIVTFFYCKGVDKGMFSLCNILDPSGRVHYGRLTPASKAVAEMFKDALKGCEN